MCGFWFSDLKLEILIRKCTPWIDWDTLSPPLDFFPKLPPTTAFPKKAPNESIALALLVLLINCGKSRLSCTHVLILLLALNTIHKTIEGSRDSIWKATAMTARLRRH
jgi:hypothetical protein